jgi:hypothetical protein
VNLDTLKAIARELDGLDVDDATLTEKNIAQLLINTGLLKAELIKSDDDDDVSWTEYKKL